MARIGYAGQSSSRLSALAGQLDGDLVRCRAEHAAGLASGDPAELLRVSESFEALGADLLAAEAAADAAVAWKRSGEPKRAAPAERRAAELAERCERPSTPALTTMGSRAHLTPAERETALLAASGFSSKEIAERLVLSPRTVDNRLQRVYEKLGISSRAELGDALEATSG
jgi:DNA-binding CsgD family transcriptional regulator